MKKGIKLKLAKVLAVGAMCLPLAGCGGNDLSGESSLLSGLFVPSNRQYTDTAQKFDYAVIAIPNGDVVEGEVQSWLDFDDGDQLQVVINGVTYLTHSTNVVLMKKGK